jgi:hypothetical protein
VASYILLYRGPTRPTGASHEGWPEWFAQIGDALIDIGSPMLNGIAVSAKGEVRAASDLNGYSLIRADDFEAVRGLVKDHPFLRASTDNSIEIFEVPRKEVEPG